MSDQNDENLDDLEIEDEETEDEETEDESEDETEDTETEGTEPKDKSDKRIRDLQSALDKEKARANKLEKLARNRDQGSDSGSNDPERAALMQELREASLDAVYGEFEALRQYGVDRSQIEGSTRAEMRESATQLAALVKSVATKARNQALREHGINAEPVSGTRSKPKNYGTMSDEEFEKELARAKSGGGPSLW